MTPFTLADTNVSDETVAFIFNYKAVGGITFLRNNGTYLLEYMLPHSKRPHIFPAVRNSNIITIVHPSVNSYWLPHIYWQVWLNNVKTLQCNKHPTKLTLQRWWTLKFLPSPRTEEFKFPTSSVPSSTHGIDLWFFTCRWMPYVV